MEQRKLEVEARLFDRNDSSLGEMIEIIGLEDDHNGKSKMQLIKFIRGGIESKMAGDEKFSTDVPRTTADVRERKCAAA